MLASEDGSLNSLSTDDSVAKMLVSRRTIQTGLPRHLTITCWPGSILLILNSTGAPADLARALGLQVFKNGTATALTPTAPTTTVAALRKRLRLLSTPSEDIRLIHD
jgi:hypothetical protein